MIRGTLIRQQGLTLIELLVSVVLMLLISIATIAIFNVSSSSYRTVDANQELQDNARFAMEIIGQAARSAGYQDRTGPTSVGSVLTDKVFGPTIVDAWRVQGANNADIGGGTGSLSFGSSNGVNKSDALVIRFFGASSTTNSTLADDSMIDCSGRSIPYPSGSLDVGVSAFYIQILNGEPELYCKSWNPATGKFSETQIVRGVETFQVMYGLDTDNDDVPNRWVSATSAWDAFTASPNWNNVVAVRVGMVLRGPVGSSQGQSATASENVLYPLGKTFTDNSTEDGLKFSPPNDGRLRRTFVATFMFQNPIR